MKRNGNYFWENEEDPLEDFDNIETRELFEPTEEEEYSFEGNEDFDEAVLDLDYSMFRGDFKQSIGKINHTIKKRAPRKRFKPLSKTFNVPNKGKVEIGGGKKQLKKVIIPRERDVSVVSVDEFIVSNDHDDQKNIGYYKGKKLKELVLSINNTSGVDFDLELFNPSMPLDYLFNTSDNLNNRVIIAGNTRVTYTDLLHNILANPTLIANARFIATGSDVAGQKREKLTFVNKALDGESTVMPLQLSLNFDLYQNQNDIILFDIIGQLNRVFIPDGMDVIQYKILAGNTVTFCFYYKQKSLKKFFYKEARVKRRILDEDKELL
jgi:hypothetical protein